MDNFSNDTELLQIISPEQAWHYFIYPIKKETSQIVFYISDTQERQSISIELEMIFGVKIELRSVNHEDLLKNLNTSYRLQQREKGSKAENLSVDSNDFLNNLIEDAKKLKSSDIHIETYEEKCRVRLRIDGLLIERYILNKNEYPSFINKIKIMSNLDISEKRLPQDGRIFFKKGIEKFDIRVSVLPTLYGEKVVLRILSNDTANIDIYELGFSERDLKNYLEGIRKPNGILLISGPTGSGKTTTLYATLKILNKESRNILTIEDPIEYTLDGINQVQLKESIGLSFGSALRTFLRQDPDVIMVGEIRDIDTASMAIRAALTGHLVLSTIHTNSAWGTVSRLVDMGVPPFMISNTLNTTVAQRLVRKLCPICKKKDDFSKELLPKAFRPDRDLLFHYVPVGCDKCFYTGYKGRKAIYEIIPIDFELSDLIKSNVYDINQQLKERGINTLSNNAFELIESGITSIDEVYSILMN